MNGFFYTIYHTKEQNVCFQMIPHMCRLVLMSGFYEELNIPTPHSRNAYFFITRLHIIGQKPKFRQCYFLVNIKYMKLHILGHILVPVSDGTGGRTGYHHKSPRLQLCEDNASVCKHIQSYAVGCFLERLFKEQPQTVLCFIKTNNYLVTGWFL